MTGDHKAELARKTFLWAESVHGGGTGMKMKMKRPFGRLLHKDPIERMEVHCMNLESWIRFAGSPVD
jgi:hypothetical protein